MRQRQSFKVPVEQESLHTANLIAYLGVVQSAANNASNRGVDIPIRLFSEMNQLESIVMDRLGLERGSAD